MTITTASYLAFKPRSPAALFWERLQQRRWILACGALFVAVVFVCLLGPPMARMIAALTPEQQDLSLGAVPPSWAHWLGTDTLGRDLLVRTMVGGRIAIGIGVAASALALLVGTAWGAIAGYAGGKVDEAMMRFVDILYAFPLTAVVIVVMAATEARGVGPLFLLIAAVSWLNIARITRAQVQSLKEREFVAAARGLGLHPARILVRHIVPNALPPVLAYATLSIPFVMLAEAFLSFLGLGVQAPHASWGTLVADGAQQLVVYPWMLVGPATVMGVTLIALNFFADGVREALDPRSMR